MAATTTLASLLSDLAEENDLGLVISGATGATTTITNSATAGISELKGLFTGAKIPIGSPVTVITAGGVGEDTYVSGFTAGTTGTLNLSPAITTGATGFIIWDPIVKHGKNVEKAISRAHQKCRRRQRTPLTFVPDGDLQGTTVTDYWTAAANGTAAYVSAQVFPAGTAADAVGTIGLNRVLQLTSTGATSVIGNGMRAVHSSQQRAGYFMTAIRLVSGAGTATLSMYDNTNGADIALQVIRGNDSYTLTVTTFGGFMICEGIFQQPATCDEVAPKLTLSATGMVAQMGPVIMFPQDAMSFPLPNRVLPESVENFHYGTTLSGPGGLESVAFSEPITTGGFAYTLQNFGDHLTVSFNFRPLRPIYFDEIVYGGALTAMTDTTTFSADMVKLWARAELYDFLMRSEMRGKRAMENGTPLPSTWRPLRNAAYKSAKWSKFEPQLANVDGRV